MKKQLKPGFFGKHVCADDSRRFLDIKNEQFLYMRKKANIVFFGDSITAQWDLKLYFKQDKLIINRGICGDTTEYAFKRVDADVLQLEPKKVVVLIGVNDIMTVWDDLWWKEDGKDPNVIMNEIAENVEGIIEKCKHLELYICSILPTSLCKPYDREYMNELIVKANKIIKELCAKHRVKYVDYYAKLFDNQEGILPVDLSYDGLHPNGKCYEIMAEVLKKEAGIELV